MGKFNMSGIDDLINDLKKMGELTGEIAGEMLVAGAEEVKKTHVAEAERRGYRKTGDMIGSIGYTNPKVMDGVLQTDIYPQGRDRKGIRNAEKAFILHYGTSSINGEHWMDTADAAAAAPAQAAMEAVYDKKLKEKGLD